MAEQLSSLDVLTFGWFASKAKPKNQRKELMGISAKVRSRNGGPEHSSANVEHDRLEKASLDSIEYLWMRSLFGDSSTLPRYEHTPFRTVFPLWNEQARRGAIPWPTGSRGLFRYTENI